MKTLVYKAFIHHGQHKTKFLGSFAIRAEAEAEAEAAVSKVRGKYKNPVGQVDSEDKLTR